MTSKTLANALHPKALMLLGSGMRVFGGMTRNRAFADRVSI